MENQEIIKIGQECMQMQITAIDSIKNSMPIDFAESVKEIASSNGKLVVVGVGKSAHIARKMVATFNSTGTPSQYLHATEAMHGDLGLIKPEDIILVASKSGETQEIRQVLPHLKRLGKKLIAITSNSRSFLGLHADLVLNTEIEKEADGLNLAPTTSTTAQLIMGDALAVTLMKIKGFSPEDFALFHPGGSLGKRLLWKVEDVVDSEQKPQVKEEDSVFEVINSLTSGRFGITVLTDNENHVQGVITDGDIRRMIDNHKNYNKLKAKDIANSKPKTVPKNMPAAQALKLLRKHKIGQLVVTDESDKYYGIIDIYSLISEGFSE